MNQRKSTLCFLIAVGFLLILSLPVIGAYSAHDNDVDNQAFLAVYPDAQGTKLDNCYLCHASGSYNGKNYDACDYCHQVYGLKPPHGDISQTLNPFGLDYGDAGGGQAALEAIALVDSDNDDFTNEEEILAGRLPGDPDDYPGVAEAPAVTFTREEIRQMPKTTQFLTVDTAKAGDFYANYSGVHMWTLLQEAGVTDDATDITVYAVDGFSKNFQIEDIKQDYDAGKFYTRYPWIVWPLDTWAKDGFKTPGSMMPAQVRSKLSNLPWPLHVNSKDGKNIPGDSCFMLAYDREGFPLQPGKMVIQNGTSRLEGEGPYRFVTPLTEPVVPDRSQWTIDREDPPYPYNPNRTIVRNGDYCIKSVVAIKVIASGEEYQYDWNGSSWQLLNNGSLVIYGAIEPK